MNAIYRKTSLALAVTAAICSAGAIGAASAAVAGNGMLATVAHTTALRHGDAVIGALPMQQPIQVHVVLKMRDPEGLDAFIENASKNHLAPMTASEFLAKHAPTEVDAQTVANYLTNMGYRNVVIAPNRMMVTADGTAATARGAFLTTMSQVKTHDGRIAYANTDEVHIPASLQDKVVSVVGLQNVHLMHTFAKVLPQAVGQSGLKPQNVSYSPNTPPFNPMDFSKIYGGTGVATAANVPVGIFTQGSLTATISNLAVFASSNGISSPATQTVVVGTPSSDTSGATEWELDSQDIVGMAGGAVQKIIFYNVNSLSNADILAGFNKIVTDNAVKIINFSIGGCETDSLNDGSWIAFDQEFAQAVAQGQTFSVSTGDDGADECDNGLTTPSSPANSRYVMAVAGTSLTASHTAYASESVWSGSGGSASLYSPKPYWQNTLFTSGTKRGVADVAFDADPATGAAVVTSSTRLSTIGGTSLSAPIFSGMWARVIAVKGSNVGFAAPLIYQLPASDFHDVTTGSNGIAAGVGYDLASGRGSMILSSAINHIGVPVGTGPTANFSSVATGLSVVFTDTSTAGSGALTTARTWDFGDGKATSSTKVTTAATTHAFAGAGTYNVQLAVLDANGNTATKTSTITVNPVATNQLIVNPGFELGSSPWSFSTAADACTNLTCGGDTSNGGTWFARLGGTGHAHTDTVSQTFNVPAGKTTITLKFSLHVNTREVSKVRAFDTLTISANGTALATTYSNEDGVTGTTYSVKTLTLPNSLSGHSVTLQFSAKEDASLPTAFDIDDVTVTTN